MALQLLKEETRIEVCDADLKGVMNPDPDVIYTLRQMPQAVAREIGRKHTVLKPNKISHRMEESQDNPAIMDDAVDYVLVAWSGVLNGGVPAECSRENKLEGLDATRKIALTEIASSNRTAAEVRAESFRSPAGVL